MSNDEIRRNDKARSPKACISGKGPFFRLRHSDFGLPSDFVPALRDHSHFRSRSRHRMKAEFRLPSRLRIERHGIITAVVEKLDAGECRTKPHVEGSPMSGVVQRCAQAPGRVSQKA